MKKPRGRADHRAPRRGARLLDGRSAYPARRERAAAAAEARARPRILRQCVRWAGGTRHTDFHEEPDRRAVPPSGVPRGARISTSAAGPGALTARSSAASRRFRSSSTRGEDIRREHATPKVVRALLHNRLRASRVGDRQDQPAAHQVAHLCERGSVRGPMGYKTPSSLIGTCREWRARADHARPGA